MKSKLLKVSVLAIFLAILSSCHTQRSLVSKDASSYNLGSANKGVSHFFVGGLGQTDRINAIEICGSEEKVKAVETKLPFLHGLVSVLTLSLYSPREYTVYCQ